VDGRDQRVRLAGEEGEGLALLRWPPHAGKGELSRVRAPRTSAPASSPSPRTIRKSRSQAPGSAAPGSSAPIARTGSQGCGRSSLERGSCREAGSQAMTSSTRMPSCFRTTQPLRLGKRSGGGSRSGSGMIRAGSMPNRIGTSACLALGSPPRTNVERSSADSEST
jgi:hypothetical protein